MGPADGPEGPGGLGPGAAAAAPASPLARPPAGGSDVHVAPVSGRQDQKRFLRFPWSIYGKGDAWVAPLLAERRALLDRRRHPFHRHADVEYFLAWRDGRVVGRIAAVVNHRYIEHHREPTGFFGFFESIDDAAVAGALLRTAEDWLRQRGMTQVLGPMNFSTNEDCGLLVEGYELPPAIMMPYNPPYYARLLGLAGYEKAKDLLAYQLNDPTIPDRLARGVARLARAEDIRIRPVDLRNFAAEVERILEVYNSAWEANWGFVPMTEEEFRHLAKQLRQVVDPAVCLVAEVEGEAIGFALALPDLNLALRHLNGRLFPFGLVRLLWHRRKIDQVRVLTLGLKPAYRRKGLDAMLYHRIFEDGPKAGYVRAECSWILEDNWVMRRALERLGGYVSKTYRIFGKTL